MIEKKKRKGGLIKTFLIGILFLGILAGVAYGAMSYGNIGFPSVGAGTNDTPGGDETPDTPPEDKPQSIHFVLDGVTHEVSLDTTWLSFCDFCEENGPQILYAGVVASADGTAFVKSGNTYPRADDLIQDGVVYTYETRVEQTCSFERDAGSFKDESFYCGMTWRDAYTPEFEGFCQPASSVCSFGILGVGSQATVWAYDYSYPFALNGVSVKADDLLVSGASYALDMDSVPKEIQFTIDGVEYHACEGMTWEQYFSADTPVSLIIQDGCIYLHSKLLQYHEGGYVMLGDLIREGYDYVLTASSNTV